MIELPIAFREMLTAQLQEDAPAFFEALEKPATLALRIDPNRPGSREAAGPFIDGEVPWEPMGYYLKPGVRPGAGIEHAGGAFYLQEASAMLSVSVLDPQPGERILDLCAAPGGKSTQIAARMHGKGLLVCNEYEPSRAKVLASNLERMGVINAVAVNARPDALAKRWKEQFDAVLCDAPCSGEGMFRRDPQSRTAWAPASPEGCAMRQAEILDSAAELVRPGGRLVYSTCTFNAYENEGSIQAFLERHPEFEAEPCSAEGVGMSETGMLRIWPHIHNGDGHFCARLRKRGNHTNIEAQKIVIAKDIIETVRKLEKEVCELPEAMSRNFVRIGDYIYAIPEGCPDMKGIRAVKNGVCLLRIGKNYIEPEHTLAMAITSNHAKRTAVLDRDNAIRYLAGETLEYEGEKGWTLVTYNELPLGWGKVSNGQLKNHLPKGLRLSIHTEE